MADYISEGGISREINPETNGCRLQLMKSRPGVKWRRENKWRSNDVNRLILAINQPVEENRSAGGGGVSVASCKYHPIQQCVKKLIWLICTGSGSCDIDVLWPIILYGANT
jgi:hypothetical protein